MLLRETFKGDSREFQVIFTGILRKFQRCLKKVSIVFQGNFKQKSRMFEEFFKEVSFGNSDVAWFTHRSYPSRRKTCFYFEKLSPGGFNVNNNGRHLDKRSVLSG